MLVPSSEMSDVRDDRSPVRHSLSRIVSGIRIFFDALELADVLRCSYEWAFVGMMPSIRLTSNGKNGAAHEFCPRARSDGFCGGLCSTLCSARPLPASRPRSWRCHGFRHRMTPIWTPPRNWRGRTPGPSRCRSRRRQPGASDNSPQRPGAALHHCMCCVAILRPGAHLCCCRRFAA